MGEFFDLKLLSILIDTLQNGNWKGRGIPITHYDQNKKRGIPRYKQEILVNRFEMAGFFATVTKTDAN